MKQRALIVVRGTREETSREALATISSPNVEHVLWVGEEPDVPFPMIEPVIESVLPRRVAELLGRSFDAVVVDLHDGLDADLLGQTHGFVWGGGALILRLPPPDVFPIERQERFALFPYSPRDVTHRFREHFERVLVRTATSPAQPLGPVSRASAGTDEQRAVVEKLTQRLGDSLPSHTVLIADRGRGKSSAIGLALRRLTQTTSLRIAITAAHRDAVGEIFRFAGELSERHDSTIDFVEPNDLLHHSGQFDVIVVDEAARLSVPLLQRLTDRHPASRMVFATTTHGYEGTGRGFSLRFVEWLRQRNQSAELLGQEEPIRWAGDDLVERFVFDALLLDAEPAQVDEPVERDEVTHVKLDRDELVGDERLLRQFFGLLIQAHYRTTPSDLHRLLDAPNLDLHALLHRGRPVAATLVAEEGGLPAELTRDIEAGARIRGHALPESLVCHLGHPEAGPLTMRRSVRIAVHPAHRRLGLGTRLIEEVHRSYEPQLFGTLFGATPGLLAFRRQAGYRLVRLSASRGARTGEPSVVMVRPCDEPARILTDRLRREFARDLPLQLRLMQAGRELDLSDELIAALKQDLPSPAALDEDEVRRGVRGYAFGPRTLESVAGQLRAFVEANPSALQTLDPVEHTLIVDRLLNLSSWDEVAVDAEMSVPAAMRALRRAIRALVNQTAGGL